MFGYACRDVGSAEGNSILGWGDLPHIPEMGLHCLGFIIGNTFTINSQQMLPIFLAKKCYFIFATKKGLYPSSVHAVFSKNVTFLLRGNGKTPARSRDSAEEEPKAYHGRLSGFASQEGSPRQPDMTSTIWLCQVCWEKKKQFLYTLFPQSRSTKLALIRKNVLKVKFGIFIGINQERVFL